MRISSAVIANDQMSHSFVRKSASKVSGAAYLATCENPADHSRPKFSKTWKRPAPLTTARLSSVIKTLDCHASSNSNYSFFSSLDFTTHWSQISVDNLLPMNIAYTLCNIRHLLQKKSYVHHLCNVRRLTSRQRAEKSSGLCVLRYVCISPSR